MILATRRNFETPPKLAIFGGLALAAGLGIPSGLGRVLTKFPPRDSGADHIRKGEGLAHDWWLRKKLKQPIFDRAVWNAA